MPLPLIAYGLGALATATAAFFGYQWYQDKMDDEPTPPIIGPEGKQPILPPPDEPDEPEAPKEATIQIDEGTRDVPSVDVPDLSPAVPTKLLIEADLLPGGTSPGGTGGGTSGNPPNLSGDPDGYNTSKYPSSLAVRKDLIALGYSMPLVSAPPPGAVTLAFQKDWNDASSKDFLNASGTVLEDGVAGKYSLRALEIATTGLDGADIFDAGRVLMWKTMYNG